MRVAVGLTLGLSLISSVALAQGDEDDQREACMGDALKFCSPYIPDRQKIAQCLEANRSQITPACRGVIDNGGRSTRGRTRG